MVWYQVWGPIIRLYTLPLGHWTCSFVYHFHGEHTVLQPFRRIELIVHIAISVLSGTHFHLSQVTHWRVKCLAQAQTSKQCPKKHYFYLTFLHQAGFEIAWQTATLAKLHTLTIAPRPSPSSEVSMYFRSFLILISFKCLRGYICS